MKDLIEASVGDAMSWSNIENAKSCQIVKSPRYATLLSFAKDRIILPSPQRTSSHPTKIIYSTTNCTEWAGDSQMRLYIELGLGLKLVREYRPLRRRLGWLTVPCTKYESTLTSMASRMRQLVLYMVDQGCF